MNASAEPEKQSQYKPNQTQKIPPKTLFFSNSNLYKNFPAILMLSFSLLLVCKQFVQRAWAEALQVNGYKLKTQRF